MAIDWSQLRKAVDETPPFVIIYGGAKNGKTTLASEFPAPYYCRTGEGERAPKGVDMVSFGVSETYDDVVQQMTWMLEAEHECKTFILDALDSLELLVTAEACARNGWSNIEEPGFGRGYAAAMGVWHEFKALCLKLKAAGYYVVLIAHVKAKTVPGVVTDSYPRYMPNLRDDAASALVDAADLIGFVHQRVSIAKEELGFKKQNKRGQGGGELLIAVQERPGYVAGNRYNIEKPTLPFKAGQGFSILSQYFPGGVEQDEPEDSEE